MDAARSSTQSALAQLGTAVREARSALPDDMAQLLRHAGLPAPAPPVDASTEAWQQWWAAASAAATGTRPPGAIPHLRRALTQVTTCMERLHERGARLTRRTARRHNRTRHFFQCLRPGAAPGGGLRPELFKAATRGPTSPTYRACRNQARRLLRTQASDSNLGYSTAYSAKHTLGAPPTAQALYATYPLLPEAAVDDHDTSGDEVVVVLFVGSFRQRTIPWQMFSGIRDHISPTILAVATILVIVSIGLLFAVELLRRRGERLRGVQET